MDAIASIEEFVSWEDILENRFSKPRTVEIGGFYISEKCLKMEGLMERKPLLFEEAATFADYCDATDRVLKEFGTRLPTEDELEAAFGGDLFPWGSELPDGVPYKSETSFKRHHLPGHKGLVYNSDPYKTELTRSALKLGDGGESICGSYPWPMAWLALSQAYRISPSELDDSDALYDFMNDAEVRQVRL
ncbi:MAG: hypothetical protein V4662_19415 [Verrucomicrobiota bacterium]